MSGQGKSAECREATLCPTLPGGPLCPAKKGVRRGAGVSPSVALGIPAASPAGYVTFCLNFPEALLSRASAILRSVPKKPCFWGRESVRGRFVPKKPGFSGRTTRKRWRERLRTEHPQGFTFRSILLSILFAERRFMLTFVATKHKKK